MATLAELARAHTTLDNDAIDHLQRLARGWSMLADLCFSDLVVYLPLELEAGEGSVEGYVMVEHVRPSTSQTIYPTVLVGEVTREDCILLLNCQQPDKTGKGRMFVSLDPDDLARLRDEFEGRGAPVEEGHWGYRTMIVRDPDGNELFFPYPAGS